MTWPSRSTSRWRRFHGTYAACRWTWTPRFPLSFFFILGHFHRSAASLVLALCLVRPSRCSTPCTCFHGAFFPSFSLFSCLWHGLGRVSLRSVSCGAFSRACFALLHRFVRTLGNCSSFSCSILLQCSFVFHYSVVRAIKFVLFCWACSSTRSCLWMVGGNTLLYFAPSTGGFAYGGGNCHSSIAYFLSYTLVVSLQNTC